ncbi:hypothetical protein Arnit_1280 [Arcobacter nitrofigilis DSM 7299]|uniref:Uncharacterized protein n=1 Tax=Arcobacter nitrofigilis (strain ATCC 33309 / DSM 7299 / CCUG 15893 / LMG 7604 / NCTC 12251 / CI) TaxID=572480 RepID=D5V4N3_ARCNC|nr:hypothetical protein [Arcobacter nitrofigilis]ADG92938.1 hypothetical protein Arnit_1280 [Arcobacter nitrofigilis DSM 7299]
MAELLFFAGALLIYLYSFLYRRFALFATLVLFIIAYKMKVDVVLICVTISILVVIRLRQHGVRDDL